MNCDCCCDVITDLEVETSKEENGSYPILCSTCQEGYQKTGNVTGYCSLSCQCGNGCDDSC